MGRSEEAAALEWGPREGDPGAAPATSRSLQPGQHLYLPPARLQPHLHAGSPFRTGLTTASEGWERAAPRLSNSWLQLERPGARVVPGMEKLPQTSRVPVRRRSQPAARAGGGGRRGRAGEGCWAAPRPAGERVHCPGRLRGPPCRQPGREARRPAPPCSGGFLRSFRLPFSLPKGVTLTTRRSLFIQGLSGRCGSACTPRERATGIFESPVPRALPHPSGPPLRSRLRAREGARQTPAARRPERGGRGRRGWVGAAKKFGSVPKKKRDRDKSARVGRKRGKGAELTQAWALGAAVAVGCGPEPGNGSPGGRTGVGLPRRRLLPPVPPPPELRLPRKLIAT